jgi:hypothetical protein
MNATSTTTSTFLQLAMSTSRKVGFLERFSEQTTARLSMIHQYVIILPTPGHTTPILPVRSTRMSILRNIITAKRLPLALVHLALQVTNTINISKIRLFPIGLKLFHPDRQPSLLMATINTTAEMHLSALEVLVLLGVTIANMCQSQTDHRSLFRDRHPSLLTVTIITTVEMLHLVLERSALQAMNTKSTGKSNLPNSLLPSLHML